MTRNVLSSGDIASHPEVVSLLLYTASVLFLNENLVFCGGLTFSHFWFVEEVLKHIHLSTYTSSSSSYCSLPARTHSHFARQPQYLGYIFSPSSPILLTKFSSWDDDPFIILQPARLFPLVVSTPPSPFGCTLYFFITALLLRSQYPPVFAKPWTTASFIQICGAGPLSWLTPRHCWSLPCLSLPLQYHFRGPPNYRLGPLW